MCLHIVPCYGAQTAPAALPPKTAESLYLQLSHVGLDPARVFRIRGGSLDRASIHITLEDGTIAFTKDVLGRITGAFFEGDGEVLLPPPNQVERRSMMLFTGMAILEERFSTAYFRFNDNTATELQSSLRAPEDAQEFLSRWNETASNLARTDATDRLRLPTSLPAAITCCTLDCRETPSEPSTSFSTPAPRNRLKLGNRKPQRTEPFTTTFGPRSQRTIGAGVSKRSPVIPAHAKRTSPTTMLL
jgi:hypothetical protein